MFQCGGFCASERLPSRWKWLVWCFFFSWGKGLYPVLVLLVSLFITGYCGMVWRCLAPFGGLIIFFLEGVPLWLAMGFLLVGVPLVCWLPLVVDGAFSEEGDEGFMVFWANYVVG